ncbi:phage tail protein [Novosphingobium sp. KN65.2]|uniref:phage tail protein n=1 Tax=Novosphingobium sp. KN65.2 TaxID=1478134 RepID=UPI0005E7046D|nr:phage tail protein [Novosphingobium sp. KN65.2]CDO35814.1 Phage P2 GpU protein [Novosphingobium sp. KN65.2]
MLAALGMFVFETNSLLPDRIGRDRDWRHERTPRFGARAASQFTGPGEDRITLAGMLVPEIAGSYSAIEKIAEMADAGEAWQLADGSGKIYGTYTIERLSEDKSNLIDDGRPRQTGFTIELSLVS